MASCNQTSGQINRFSKDKSIWIASNVFQYALTLILSQVLIMLYQDTKAETKKNKFLEFFKIEDHCCPYYVQVMVACCDCGANLMVGLSLRNTSITHYSMIANSICMVNLVLSILFLTRRFVGFNQAGSILAFASSLVLAFYSGQVNKEQNVVPQNLWLGNICTFCSVLCWSFQNLVCDKLSENFRFDTFMWNRNINFAAFLIQICVSFADMQIFNLLDLLGDYKFVQVQLVHCALNTAIQCMIPDFIGRTSASFFGVICLLSGLFSVFIDMLLNKFKSDYAELACYATILLGAILFNQGEYIVSKLRDNEMTTIKVDDPKENLIKIKD